MSLSWYIMGAFFFALFGAFAYMLIWMMRQYLPPLPFAILECLLVAFCVGMAIAIAWNMYDCFRRFGVNR